MNLFFIATGGYNSCQTQQSIAQHSLYTVTDDNTEKVSDLCKEMLKNL